MTHAQAVKAAVEAMGKWDGSGRYVSRLEWRDGQPYYPADGEDGKPLDGWHLAQRLREINDQLAPIPQDMFWRGTNRRGEYADVLAGKQIVSRNHRDGNSESGMSVCTTAAYVVMAGFKFGYQVAGDVIGEGSDGEPIITNCRPLGTLMTANQVFARDSRRRKVRRWLEAVAAQCGTTVDELTFFTH